MKVLQINSVSGIRSTGRICSDVAKMLKNEGDDCLIVYGRVHTTKECEKFSLRIGNTVTNVAHYLSFMLHDDDGKGSYFLTRSLIKKIKAYNPDVIHIHNLHGHYINYNLLMDYLAKADIPTVFSFYDCWMFTGNCTHFDYIGCNKWETHCGRCPAQGKYPLDMFWIDRSAPNFDNKKSRMEKIRRKIITPGSYWMEGLVRRSFLRDSEIETVQSGIDLSVFKPAESDIKLTNGVKDCKVVLCVASTWSDTKGSSYLNSVAEKLDGKAKLVVIGKIRNENCVTHHNILHIPETDSAAELVKWYSASDVFLNLTLQETLGLTNVEALACGTPVVTFNSGGCPECVDEKCGRVVERGDVDGAVNAVMELLDSEKPTEACLNKSKQFDKNVCYRKYIDIYKKLCEDKAKTPQR